MPHPGAHGRKEQHGHPGGQSQTRRCLRGIAAAAAVAALPITACGGDDGDGDRAREPARTSEQLFDCLAIGGYAEADYEMLLDPARGGDDLGEVTLQRAGSPSAPGFAGFEATFYAHPSEASAAVERDIALSQPSSDDERWEVIAERVAVRLFDPDPERGEGTRMLAALRGCLERGGVGDGAVNPANAPEVSNESDGGDAAVTPAALLDCLDAGGYEGRGPGEPIGPGELGTVIVDVPPMNVVAASFFEQASQAQADRDGMLTSPQNPEWTGGAEVIADTVSVWHAFAARDQGGPAVDEAIETVRACLERGEPGG